MAKLSKVKAAPRRKNNWVWAAAWIAALPCALLVSFIGGSAFTVNTIPLGVCNVTTLLLGLYFFVGWIPVVIVYGKGGKK